MCYNSSSYRKLGLERGSQMKKGTIAKIIGFIVIVAAICGAMYAIYRYLVPTLEDEFEDDIDDVFGPDVSDFEDDVFEE